MGVRAACADDFPERPCRDETKISHLHMTKPRESPGFGSAVSKAQMRSTVTLKQASGPLSPAQAPSQEISTGVPTRVFVILYPFISKRAPQD